MDLTGFARLMLRSAYYAGLGALGLPALMRRFRAAGVVLCYHNVCSTGAAARAGEPAVHLPVDRFAAQARWLARHYDVVPLRELVGRLEAGRSLRGLAAVTFDDAYAGVFTHAWPLLLELGLPATVFVVGDASDAHAARRPRARAGDRLEPGGGPRAHPYTAGVLRISVRPVGCARAGCRPLRWLLRRRDAGLRARQRGDGRLDAAARQHPCRNHAPGIRGVGRGTPSAGPPPMSRDAPLALSGARIAQLIESDGPGGAERMLAQLAGALQSAGCPTIAFLPAGGEGWLDQELPAGGVGGEHFRITRGLSPRL